MYIICTYDVKDIRCAKVMKVCRQYLFHVQESVFEGTLTPHKFNCLKKELDKIIHEEDSVHFYISYDEKQFQKEYLGKKDISTNII